MREIFTSGSVGGAPGNWCFYPELLTERIAPFFQHRMIEYFHVNHADDIIAYLFLDKNSS